MPPVKTSIYIDGFNLYHRSLKDTPYKWLDFKSLFSKILPPHRNEINHIKYFTSPVSALEDVHRPQRQDAYIRALKAYIPEIEIYWGRFQTHPKSMPKANPDYPTTSSDVYLRDAKGNLIYDRVVRVEEKGSDVNIAMHLLNDAWLNQYGCAVLVSNDNDIAGALTLLEKYHPKKIRGLITPFCAASLRASLSSKPLNPDHLLTPAKDLIDNVNFVRQMREGVLRDSQLPDIIPGTTIHKPIDWCCGRVSKYPFQKEGLDFDLIIPKCIQKGYVTSDYQVDLGFLTVDQEFKGWFPQYNKSHFNQIQSLLHLFRSYRES